MSKVDAQRAMREAKYARDRASGPTRREAAAAAAGQTTAPTQAPGTTPVTAPRKAAAPRSASTKPAASKTAAPKRSTEGTPAAAVSVSEVCGHRSMNGRTCTRPAGHNEKSHRYG